LNNEIGYEGEGPSVQVQQQNIDTSEYSVRMGSMCIPPPSETSEAVVRTKTSVVWKFFDKNDTNDKATCKICKVVYVHKKGRGTRILDRHMKKSHMDWYENLLK
jgi:hypothetical protein